MSMPDWESLQVKVVRALFLAVSSVFVVFYGFSAFASEHNAKELADDASALAKVITAKPFAKAVLPQQAAPLAATESRVPLAHTMPLSSTVSSSVVSLPTVSVEATVAPVQLSRIDRQHTPAVDINAAPAEPNISSDTDSPTSIPVENACDDDRLDIPTRFGASYNTSSAGFDDIIGVNTFIPLSQDGCEDVTFFEGRAMLSDGEPSFSLNVGHRNYDAEDDIINGGYLGVDSRATDSNTFYQLAAGYERIQDNWELRLNGYLPLGDQTNTLQSVVDDSAVQTASGFEANQLVLSAVGERQRILQQENALGGFDVEVGGQLDEWYGGELRGYAGAYLLTGEDSGLGVQARLLADFESSFNAGLSVQHDGIFGTSVGFSIGASLPGIRFHDEGERSFQEENEVVIRLRDPLVRRPTVAVNVIDESEIVAVDEREALRNPEEEQDYRFVHVDLAQGAGAGDGTFENPFGAVEDAIALINTDTDTYSDGNTIVYVDGENAPTTTIPGFAIPDRVRVLSQGPAQTIAGMDFPGFPSTATRLPFSAEQNFNVESDAPNANGITVELPDSNDGVFPTITGGATANLVTLGESTVLAGFEIRDAANHGVTAANINNVELRNNLIENSGGSGVSLDNVGGSVVLFDNEINGSGDRGIQIQNSVTEQSVEVAIAGFDLDNNQVGMEFLAMASDTEFPSQRVTVGPSSEANTSVGTPNGTPLTNSILNSAGEGIVAEATGSTTSLASAATQELEVSDTTIDNSGADGIRLLTRDGSSSQEFTFTRGTVSDSAGNGFTLVNGEDNGGMVRTAAAQEIVIRESTISGNDGNGIDVTLADAGAQELVIRGNQIVENGGDGIRSIAQNLTTQEWRTDAETGDAGISENTISGNGGQEIAIAVEDFATIPIVSVVDNTLSGNTAGPDLEIVSTSSPGGSAAACLIVRDNLAPAGMEFTGADPILTGGNPSVLVQDLPTLLTDANIVFLADLLGARTESTAPFQNETDRCIP